MKRIKITAALLCLLMLCGTVLLFTSCKKEAKLTLTDYTVVYDATYGTALKNEAGALAGRLQAVVGTTVAAVSSKKDAVAKEILIGDTGRPETEAMLAKITGHGYAIGVEGEKLVIVGTTDLLTVKAMQVFCDTVLENATGAEIAVPSTVASDVEMIELSAFFNVIYSARMNDESDADGGKNDGPDYGYEAAAAVRQSLRGKLGFSSTQLALRKDDTAAEAKELLVGLVDREAVDIFLQNMDVNDYGIAAINGRVVVAGLNDAGLAAAVKLFTETVETDTVGTGNDEKMLIPADFKWVISRNTDFVTDFPRPSAEGVALSGSVDAGDGAISYLYTGTGVNAASYRAYLTKLEAAGYVRVQDNEIEGSLFATYTHAGKKQKLHVAYTAFSHAKTQKVTLYEQAIRIVTAGTDTNGNGIETALLAPRYDYEKVTDTRLTTLRMNYEKASGMCYVVQLEDGSFMVQDGGYKAGEDYKRLYNVLADLHKQAFGTAPTAADPIVISVWYLTHSHGDHYQNFQELCKVYGDKIELRYLITNNPSEEQGYNTHDPNYSVRNNMSTIFGYTQGDTKYIKVHAGQRLYFANMELEVMMAPEDIYPYPIDVFNNASVVCRSTFTATDGAGHAEGKTTDVLWLGDIMGHGSKYMRAMYGTGLESDIVQVAHHGLSGAELALYKLVAPEIVLWPGGLERLAEVVSNTNASGYKKVSATLYQNLDSVKYHIFADVYNTTVTITKDGPDMSVGGATGLYNAGESGAVTVTVGTKNIGAVVKK